MRFQYAAIVMAVILPPTATDAFATVVNTHNKRRSSKNNNHQYGYNINKRSADAGYVNIGESYQYVNRPYSDYKIEVYHPETYRHGYGKRAGERVEEGACVDVGGSGHGKR